MKRILITGGSGFIGTNLIENLKSFTLNEVLSIDIVNPKIESHRAIFKLIDIREKNSLSKAVLDFNPEVVIHFAARTDLNGTCIDDYNTNTIGVSNLIEVLNELKSLDRVIFTSSMYVCEPGYFPKNYEDYKPHTVYGESKVLSEEIIKSAKLNFSWVIIRPTSIWGPWFGQPYLDFFKIVMSGRYFHIGSKACTKTYGYIDNTVYQILSLLNVSSEKINKNIYYLGDLPAYDISMWADEIAEHIGIKIHKIPFSFFQMAALVGDILKIIGIKFPMTSFRLKNMTTNNILDLIPIMEIADNPPVSRKDGIKNTIDWIKKSNFKKSIMSH